ncbi:hypothetical protein WU86_07805 [Corynebacterium xerosis]|nr:hypothetical protein WU86_07805 [Corynebacterium xerosis]
MGDHDELLVQLRERRGQQLSVAQVQKRRRFVCDDQLRFEHEHRRQRQQLLLPARQQVRGMVRVAGEVEAP